MKCPACQHTLQQIEYKGVTIHECPHCHGEWFDKEELSLAKNKTDEDLRWLDFDLFDKKHNKFSHSKSHKICPKDNSPMTALEYMDSKVVLDECDTCEGIWLDHHEFEKLIAYLKKKVVNESASEYAKDAVKELEEILIGSKDKVTEIKDFLTIMKLFEKRLAVEHPWTIALSESINHYWPVR